MLNTVLFALEMQHYNNVARWPLRKLVIMFTLKKLSNWLLYTLNNHVKYQAVFREIFGHNRIESLCFQVQPVTC